MKSKLEPHFKRVPKTGVIYIMTEAKKHGYHPDDGEWVNFGQGQPETSKSLAPEVIEAFASQACSSYGPADGTTELKQTVADYYNRRFRKGMASQYTDENVVISPGGRAGLTRIIASLGNLNLGHFLPDYTAYEELLGTFNNFTSIPIALKPEELYRFTPAQLEQEIIGKGLGALLLSNPCNPTGKLIEEQELAAWVDCCRRMNCALILDEFYSKYIWTDNRRARQVSAAEFVDDVNDDPVLIFDGITKNWHFPGLRVSWTIGPKQWIHAISSSASFLDGGAGHPNQKIACALLQQNSVEKEKENQAYYRHKRDYMIQALKEIGIQPDIIPNGTFYLWCDVRELPDALNDGRKFFLRGLQHKLISSPGEFFDINPGGRRFGRVSRFKHHVRLSFGPSKEEIQRGIEKIRVMIKSCE